MKSPATLTFLLLFIAGTSVAETVYEADGLRLRLGFPQPQSLAAFYEGRGFSKEMIEVIRQQCFVNVIVSNRSKDFIWLDLTQWQFTTADGNLQRLDRSYWKKRWGSLHIPLAHQSTFRWTLIPEALDLHPDEGEGGNLILPRQDKPMRLTATFPTGAEKQGKPIVVHFENLSCGVDK